MSSEMDFATLYAEDVETWAELQVAALRRLATMPGPWANTIDWENVIEEIEDLGSSQREAVESLLENALSHVLKILADPDSLSAGHWKSEVRNFLRQARIKLKPSMRRRIDMDEVWARAHDRAVDTLEAFDRPLPNVPDKPPFSLEQVLDPAYDLVSELRGLVAKESRPG